MDIYEIEQSSQSSNNDESKNYTLYCMINPTMPGVCKIGCTTNPVIHRAKQLSSTSHYTDFKVEFYIHVEDSMIKYEKLLHDLLDSEGFKRINPKREFFRCEPKDIKKYFDKKVLKLYEKRTVDEIYPPLITKEDIDNELLIKKYEHIKDLYAEKDLKIKLCDLEDKDIHNKDTLSSFIAKKVMYNLMIVDYEKRLVLYRNINGYRNIALFDCLLYNQLRDMMPFIKKVYSLMKEEDVDKEIFKFINKLDKLDNFQLLNIVNLSNISQKDIEKMEKLSVLTLKKIKNEQKLRKGNEDLEEGREKDYI